MCVRVAVIAHLQVYSKVCTPCKQNDANAVSINLYLPEASKLYHPDQWDSVAESVQLTAVV